MFLVAPWELMAENIRLQARDWAEEEFFAADLGDAKRERRLVRVAMGACLHPHGRITEAFPGETERGGVYDFLENDLVCSSAIQRASASACAKRCSSQSVVLVAIDGSSLSLTDVAGAKDDLGRIGTDKDGARGLKLINAVAISEQRVLLGNLSFVWWARSEKVETSADLRKVEDKETQYWHQAIEESSDVLDVYAKDTVVWYQLDREADAWSSLLCLHATGKLFTVRSKANRRIRVDWSTEETLLRDHLQRQFALGYYELDVPAGKDRTARKACMRVVVAKVTLILTDKITDKEYPLAVNVVWCRETGPVPKGEKHLEWCLLTNRQVETLEEACQVIKYYSYRWTIEQFYRTWKEGHCHVEDTQLHYADHIIKWAIILAAVAMRAERLKQVARTTPELPASTQFSPEELKALVLLKKKYKTRNEVMPDGELTLGVAVLWTAQLGGYTGKSSGGPPGATTIARGLERLAIAAEAIATYEQEHGLPKTTKPIRNRLKGRRTSP